jgi:cytoskeletal protein CcmA (bactofilin family)
VLRKVKDWVVTSGKIETVLGPNTSFNGHLKADGNLRIEGLYEGIIETAGNVIIGENAKVRADIRAHSIQVWGTINGTINASERLEILSSGRVFADIVVKSLLTDDGGVFRGKCVIRGLESGTAPEPAAENQPPQES